MPGLFLGASRLYGYTRSLLVAWCLTQMSLVDSDDQPPASPQQSSARFVNYRPVEVDPRAPHILNKERPGAVSSLDLLQSYKFLLGFLVLLVLSLILFMRRRGKLSVAKDNPKPRIPQHQTTVAVRRSGTSLRPQAAPPKSTTARSNTASVRSTLNSTRSEVAPTSSPLHTTRLSLTRHSSTCWTLVGRTLGSKETPSKKDSKIPWLPRWCFPIYSPLKAIHSCLDYARTATQRQTQAVECSTTQAVSPTARPSTAYLSPQSFAVTGQPSSHMIYPHSSGTQSQELLDNNRLGRSNSRSSPVEARVDNPKAQTDEKCKFTTKLDITVVESASVRADSRRESRQVLVQREITPSQHQPGQQYDDIIRDSITLSSVVCDKFASENSVSAYIMPRSDLFETRAHKKGQVVSEKKARNAKKRTEDRSLESTDRVSGLTMDRFKKVECLKATEVTDKLFFSHCDSDVCHDSEADAQLKYQTKFGQSLSKCQKTTTEAEIATSSQQPASESRALPQKSDTELDQHTTISSVLCADDAVSDLLSGNLTSTCRKVYECSSVYSHHPALTKEPNAHRNSHRAAELKSNLRAKIQLEEIEEVSETVKDTDARITSPSSDQDSQGNKSDHAFSNNTSPPTTTTQLRNTSPGPKTTSGKKILHRRKTPDDKLQRKPRSDGTNKKAQPTLTHLCLVPEVDLKIPKKESSGLDGPLAALTFLGRDQHRIPAAVKPNVADKSKHHLLGRDLGRKQSHKAREFCEMKVSMSSNNQLSFYRDCQPHVGTAASPMSGKSRAHTQISPISGKFRAGTPNSIQSGAHQLKTRHQRLKSPNYALPNNKPEMFQSGKQQELPGSGRVQDCGDSRCMSVRQRMYKHQQVRSRVSDEEGLYQEPPEPRCACGSNEDRNKLYVTHDGKKQIPTNRKIGLPVSTPDPSISDSIRHVSDWLASLSQEKDFPQDLQPHGKRASLGDHSSHPQTRVTRPKVAPGVEEHVTSVQDEEEVARQLIAYKNATHSSHLINKASTEEVLGSLRLRNKTTGDTGVSREFLYSSPEVNSKNQLLNQVRNRQDDRRASHRSPTSYPQKSTSKSAAPITVSPKRDFDRGYRSNQLSRRRLTRAVVTRQAHTSWPGKGTLIENNKLPHQQAMDAPSYLQAPGSQQRSDWLADSCQMSSDSERTVSEPLTLELSNFAQIPLFTNRNKESVNIIVQLDPDKHSRIGNNTLVPNLRQTAQGRFKSRARDSCSPVIHRFSSRQSPSPTDARLQAVSFSKSIMLSRKKEHLRRTSGNYPLSQSQQLNREKSTHGSIRNMRRLDHQPTGIGHTRFYHLAQDPVSPRKKMTSAGLSDRDTFSQHHSYLGIQSVPSTVTRLSGLSLLEDNQSETKASSRNSSVADALSDTRLSVDLDKLTLSEEEHDEFKDVNIPLQLARNRQPVHGWPTPESGRDILEVPKQDRRFKSPVSQRRAAQSKTTGRGQYQTCSFSMAARAGQSENQTADTQEPTLEDYFSPTEANTSVKEKLLRSSHSGRIQVRHENDSISLAAGQHFNFAGPCINPNSTSSFQSRTRASAVVPLRASQKNPQAASRQAPGLQLRKPSSLSSQTRNFKCSGIDSRPQQQDTCSSLQPPHQPSATNPRADTQSIGDSTLTTQNSRYGINNREILLQVEESITNDNFFKQEKNYKTNELPKHDQGLLSQKCVKRLANEKYDRTVVNKKDYREAGYQKDISHSHFANQRQVPRAFSPSLTTKNRWKQSGSGVRPTGNTTENRSCADSECGCWHLDTGGRDRYLAAVFQSQQLNLADARTSDSQFSDLDDPVGSRGSPGRTTSIQSRDKYKNQQGKKSGAGYKLSSEEFESFPVVGHAGGQVHPSSEGDVKEKNLSHTDYATAKEQTAQLEHPRDLRSSSQCSTQFSDVETLPSNVSPQGNVLDCESVTEARPSAKGRNRVYQPVIMKQKRYIHSFSSSPTSRNERDKFLSDHNNELKSFTSERKHLLRHEDFDREGYREISNTFKRKENNGDLTARKAKRHTNTATKAQVLKFDRVSGLSTSSTAVSLNQVWAETTAKISPRQARLVQTEASITPRSDSFHKSLTHSKQAYVTSGQSYLLRRIFKSCLGPATSHDEHGERESVRASVTRLHKYQPRVAKIKSLHKLMNARSRSGHLISMADLSLRRTQSFLKSCRAKCDRVQKETTGQHARGLASDQQHDVNNTSSHQTISMGPCVARHSSRPEEDVEISAILVSAIDDVSRLSGRVHDDKEAYTDDCCLPDRLPSKIDGSTDGTSRSDVSLLQTLDSLGRPKTFTRTPKYNLATATLGVDPLRDRYLHVLMTKSPSFEQETNKGQQNYNQDTDATAIMTQQPRVEPETKTERPASCPLSVPLSKVSQLTRSIHSPKAVQPSNNAIKPDVKGKWPLDELYPGKTQTGQGSQYQRGHHRSISNTPTKNNTDRRMSLNPDRPMNPRDKQREAVSSCGVQSQTLVKQKSSENGKASPRSAQISKSNSCTSGSVENNTHVGRPETNSSRANNAAKNKQLRDDSAENHWKGIHPPKDLRDDMNVLPQETSENVSTNDQGGPRSTQPQDGDMKVKNASYTVIRVPDSHAETRPVGEARANNSQGATVTQPLQGDQHPQDVKMGSVLEGKRSSYQTTAGATVHLFKRQKLFPTPVNKKAEVQTNSQKIQSVQRRSLPQTEPCSINQNDIGINNSKNITVRQTSLEGVKKAAMRQAQSVQRRNGSGPDQPPDLQHTAETSSSSTEVALSWVARSVTHETQDSEGDYLPVSVSRPDPPHGSLSTVCGYLGETPNRDAHNPTLDKLKREHKDQDDGGINTLVDSCQHKDVDTEPLSGADNPQRADTTSNPTGDEKLACAKQSKAPVYHGQDAPAAGGADSLVPFWAKKPQLGSHAVPFKGRTRQSPADCGRNNNVATNHTPDVLSQPKLLSEKTIRENAIGARTTKTNKQIITHGGSRRAPQTFGREHKFAPNPVTPAPAQHNHSKGLAKNRRYVSSALMYTMKKQNAQDKTTRKEAALGTNNSAQSGKSDSGLPPQPSSQLPLFNSTIAWDCFRVLPEHKDKQQAVADQKLPLTYRLSHANANDDTSTKLTRVSPKYSSSQSDSSYGYTTSLTRHKTAQAASSLNQDMEESCLKKSISAPNNLPLGFGQDLPQNDQASQIATNFIRVIETSNSTEERDGDDSESKSSASSDDLPLQSGSSLHVASLCKVNFDWYKPSANRVSPETDTRSSRGSRTESSQATGNLRQVANEEQGLLGDRTQPTYASDVQHNECQCPRVLPHPRRHPHVCPELEFPPDIFGCTLAASSHTTCSKRHTNKQTCTCMLPETTSTAANSPHCSRCFNDLQPPSYVCPGQTSHYCHGTKIHNTARKMTLSSDLGQHPASRAATVRPLPSKCPLPAQLAHSNMSSLNLAYQSLRHKYNEANALFHSNWMLANQNIATQRPVQYSICCNKGDNHPVSQHMPPPSYDGASISQPLCPCTFFPTPLFSNCPTPDHWTSGADTSPNYFSDSRHGRQPGRLMVNENIFLVDDCCCAPLHLSGLCPATPTLIPVVHPSSTSWLHRVPQQSVSTSQNPSCSSNPILSRPPDQCTCLEAPWFQTNATSSSRATPSHLYYPDNPEVTSQAEPNKE